MPNPILYKSTNGNSPLVDFKTAMLYPDPPDNGLYVPNRIPRLNDSLVREFEKMTYPEVTYHVLRPWFADKEISDRELEEMIDKTFTWSLPVQGIGDDFYGDLGKTPYLAFKCFGAHGNAMLIEHYHNPEKEGVLISINSTSGDTGGSVAKAQHNNPNIITILFFPIDDITTFQRRQMTTLMGNAYAIGVRTNFDGCQVLREYCLGNENPELARYTRTTGNSKSMGRFLPQIPYHFYISAYVRKMTGKDKVNLWIPIGNGGNFNSAQYAKLMGAPVNILGAVSNENAVFPNFINTGVYDPIKEVKKCPSSAMDVGNPSNIQRIAYLAGGCIDRDGIVHKMPDLESMRKEIRTTSISNTRTREAIRFANKYGVILDPHGAVAYKGMLEFKDDLEVSAYPNAFEETADPVKFPDLIKEELGIEPELPRRMKNIYDLEERMYVIEPDKRQASDLILEIVKSRA